MGAGGIYRCVSGLSGLFAVNMNQSFRRSMYSLGSLHALVVGVTFLAIFAMSARISVDTDTWWHLRAGQWIVENRAVPQVDLFSYTRLGEAWQYPGWLVEAPMYWIYQAVGAGGLNLWTAVMVTLAFAFVYRTLQGGVFLRAFVMVLATAVSGVYWAARPYLATFVLGAVYLWILEEFCWRRTPVAIRRLWWLPVWMVVWANCHGGFAVGFLLWGVYAFAEVVQWFQQKVFLAHLQLLVRHPLEALRSDDFRLFWMGLLMILAVCINPSGIVMLAYPFKTVSIGALQDYIQEWQSPNFHSLSVQPFIWLLLATFGAVGVSRRRLALSDFLLVSGFAYMGLLAGRNVALFALAAPPVLARHLAPVMAALSRRFGVYQALSGARMSAVRPRQARLNWLLLGVLSLAVLAKLSLVLPAAANEEVFRKGMPVAAVELIQQKAPPGNLFNSYNWGGYLLWMLPEYPVFLDGRTDLYNDEVIGQWLQVARAEDGWQQVLERWQVRLILLERTMPVIQHLEDQGWQKLYEDDIAVIYVR